MNTRAIILLVCALGACAFLMTVPASATTCDEAPESLTLTLVDRTVDGVPDRADYTATTTVLERGLTLSLRRGRTLLHDRAFEFESDRACPVSIPSTSTACSAPDVCSYRVGDECIQVVCGAGGTVAHLDCAASVAPQHP